MFIKKLIRRQENASTDPRRHTGQSGESLAVKVLKQNGYKILEKNYSSKLGEIDVIAQDGSVLAFIEVKARRTAKFGSPKLAVTPRKQRKISMVALQYLKETGQTSKRARFDVVAIRLLPGQPDIEIIKNAFDLAY
jgi:putative endonuclease